MPKALKDLLPWKSLVDISKAAERVVTALKTQQKIIIVGDFDTDGATATAVSIKALRAFGAQNVSYQVPNRFDFGYGLSPELVKHILATDQPDLIITVDNGIASHAGVSAAQAAKVDVIITDHHLPPSTLPDAVAIVNPNREDDDFARNLASWCCLLPHAGSASTTETNWLF